MIHTTQTHQIGDNVELMRKMPAESIDTIVTSPPYWGLRDYGVDGQIGLEPTLEEYHARMLDVTAECMRVLKPTGVMFWNHGDSYFGDSPIRKSAADQFDPNEQHVLKRSAGGIRRSAKSHGGLRPKCMTMQNERLIIRMIDDQGWILRNRIIWNKPNGMPSSVNDRFSNKYEPVYMLVKSKKYWFDLDAVRVPFKDASEVQYRKKLRANKEYDVKEPYKTNTPYKHNAARITSQESPNRMWKNSESLERQIAAGKNPGDVWTIPTQPYPESHFATFPTTLIEPMVKAACPDGGTVLDPFCGSGTVLEVCRLLNRNAIGLELNPEYETLIKERSMAHTPPLTAY